MKAPHYYTEAPEKGYKTKDEATNAGYDFLERVKSNHVIRTTHCCLVVFPISSRDDSRWTYGWFPR